MPDTSTGQQPDTSATATGATATRAPDVITPAGSRSPDRTLWGLAALTVTAGVVLRFWPRSGLWLDEALSVNIASLPLSEITGALRHDGHPPLYYVLLHYWISVFGASDWSVRALSGVISSLTLPVMFIAGRHLARRQGGDEVHPMALGLVAVTLTATIPFAVRYGAETRMYALVMLLVAIGYVLVDELLGPAPARLTTAAAAAVVAAALLWTHYWSIWILGSVGIMALFTLWRRWGDAYTGSGPGSARRGPILVIGALVVGGLTFVPWLPVMSFQAAHTGTPWGAQFGPVSVLVITLVDFAGAKYGVAQFLSYIMVTLVVGAAMVSVRKSSVDTGGVTPKEIAEDTAEELVVDQLVSPRVRAELAVLIGTLALGWAAARASGNTFSSRYASVVLPLFVLAVAAGICLVRRTRPMMLAISVVCALSIFGAIGAARAPRSQSGQIARVIDADLETFRGPAVVISCPDQLGVSLQREITARPALHARVGQVVPFPAAGDPRFIDWVDYGERNTNASPQEFLHRISDQLTPATTLYLVSSTRYRTFEGKCEALADLLATGRQHKVLVDVDSNGGDEEAALRVFRPR